MDSSVKGKIMTGMIVGAFLFALLAVIGSSWMTADEDGVEASYSLSTAKVEAMGMSIEAVTARLVTNRMMMSRVNLQPQDLSERWVYGLGY